MQHCLGLLATVGSTRSWYDIVYLVAGIVFVYPERLIDLLWDVPGRRFAVPSVRDLQVGAGAAAVGWSLFLFAVYPKFEWSHLILTAGAAAVVRGIRVLIVRCFDLEE